MSQCNGSSLTSETTAQPTKTHHSSHAPPPSQAHIRELFRLELKFAALRDQLYVERMEEVAAEEEMILNGELVCGHEPDSRYTPSSTISLSSYIRSARKIARGCIEEAQGG